MSVQLYYLPPSPPCRAVLLTAEAIGLEMELIMLNPHAGDPEYEQLNPQRTIPFLVDDDLKISESRAIMTYLVEQYGENDTLYPQNPEARALIDQRLYFDLGTLYASVFNYYMPVLKKQIETHDPMEYENMTQAFHILDKFLEGHDYVAGDNLTIADLSLVSSVTTAEAFGFHLEDYENVTNWLEKVQTFAPGYEKANGEPCEMFKKFVEDLRGEEKGEEEEEKDEEKGEEEEEKDEEKGEEEEEKD
ncbi:glutathione S-transferase 1-1, partial [Camponotus floridanus]|uniref:glutathione S-transferase 1-1 n=1 Tax=Camponotus floridanus TaxID=104421 RepID=UPI000DC6C644